MKKRILPGFFGLIVIVAAIYIIKINSASAPNDDNSGTVTEQDRPLIEKEPTGDGMIWESLSRHFMTIE